MYMSAKEVSRIPILLTLTNVIKGRILGGNIFMIEINRKQSAYVLRRTYPAFQKYLRTYQPKLLAIWGKEDPSFIWSGAEAFRKDLPDAKIIPVNSGHFALENCCAEIAQNIREFF